MLLLLLVMSLDRSSSPFLIILIKYNILYNTPLGNASSVYYKPLLPSSVSLSLSTLHRHRRRWDGACCMLGPSSIVDDFDCDRMVQNVERNQTQDVCKLSPDASWLHAQELNR